MGKGQGSVLEQHNYLAYKWISQALRRLSVGQRHVEKWLVCKSEREVEEQVVFARKFLSLMLEVFGNAFYKTGDVARCDRTQAYVQSHSLAVELGVEHLGGSGQRAATGQYILHIC